MIDFTGQVAWVTGAARKPGIGAAVARLLAEHGADVALVDVVVDQPPAADTYEASPDRLDAAVAAVEATGRRARSGWRSISPTPTRCRVRGAHRRGASGGSTCAPTCRAAPGPASAPGPLLDVDPAPGTARSTSTSPRRGWGRRRAHAR